MADRSDTAERRDGLHCVYGTCQGLPCNPGCSFTMTCVSDLEIWRRQEAKAAERQHRVSYLAELHTLVGELLNRSPGFEWVAVDRETFSKLRRLHGGDAP